MPVCRKNMCRKTALKNTQNMCSKVELLCDQTHNRWIWHTSSFYQHAGNFNTGHFQSYFLANTFKYFFMSDNVYLTIIFICKETLIIVGRVLFFFIYCTFWLTFLFLKKINLNTKTQTSCWSQYRYELEQTSFNKDGWFFVPFKLPISCMASTWQRKEIGKACCEMCLCYTC